MKFEYKLAANGAPIETAAADYAAGTYPNVTGVYFGTEKYTLTAPIVPAVAETPAAFALRLATELIPEIQTGILDVAYPGATLESMTFVHSTFAGNELFTLTSCIISQVEGGKLPVFQTLATGIGDAITSVFNVRFDFGALLLNQESPFVLANQIADAPAAGSNYGSSVNNFPGSTFAGRV